MCTAYYDMQICLFSVRSCVGNLVPQGSDPTRFDRLGDGARQPGCSVRACMEYTTCDIQSFSEGTGCPCCKSGHCNNPCLCCRNEQTCTSLCRCKGLYSHTHRGYFPCILLAYDYHSTVPYDGVFLAVPITCNESFNIVYK